MLNICINHLLQDMVLKTALLLRTPDVGGMGSNLGTAFQQLHRSLHFTSSAEEAAQIEGLCLGDLSYKVLSMYSM